MATEYPPYQPIQASSWKAAEAKFLFDIVLGKMLQPEPRNPADQLVPYLRAANVQWSGVSLSDVASMYASEGEILSCSIAQGDLLVCEGGEVGRAAIYSGGLPDVAIIQNALHRVRSKNGNSARYLCYVLRHLAWSGWFDVLCNKATIAHFTVDKFGELQIAYPEPHIQELIADFLDSETARLDTLISEKQRLLNLLTDKRRAVIADFLTKGLNKDAPRRDSEIPWLGEIPAHWQTFPIRRLIRSLEQGWSPVASNLPAEPEEFGVLKLSAIKNGRFLPDENKALSPDAEVPADLSICEDDVFITRANTPKLVGDVALSERHYSNLIFSDLIYRLKIDTRKALPAWTVLALLSDIGRTQIESEAKGSSGSMVKLSQDQVLDIVLPVPPLEEQQAIVQRVQDEIRKLDALAEATERTITLLQERRSALISAAVTGEIEIGEATI